jgi:hypothetical protein
MGQARITPRDASPVGAPRGHVRGGGASSTRPDLPALLRSVSVRHHSHRYHTLHASFS